MITFRSYKSSCEETILCNAFGASPKENRRARQAAAHRDRRALASRDAFFFPVLLVEVQERVPELRGSIGEGPNHSNSSDQSSVTVVSERLRSQGFILEFIRNPKNQESCSTFSRICGEILRNFHENLSNIQSNLFENIKIFKVLPIPPPKCEEV